MTIMNSSDTLRMVAVIAALIFPATATAQAPEPIAHEGGGGLAVVAARHGGEHRAPKLLDFGPFGTALGAQQVERHRLDQSETLHLGPKLSSGFERQGRAIGMADEVHGRLRLLGKLAQHRKVCLAGEDLVLGPGVGLAIADEVGSEHAPLGAELLDQRQPLFVGG